MPHPWFCLVNGYFYTRQNFPHRGKKEGEAEKSEEQKREERLRHMEEGKTHLRHWHSELLPGYVEHAAQHRRLAIAEQSARELVEWIEMLAEEAGEIWYIIAPIGYGFEEMGFRPHYEEKIPAEGRQHFSVLFSGYPSRIFDGQQALYELAQQVRAADGLVDVLESDPPLEELPEWLVAGVRAYAEEFGHQLTSIDFFWPTSGEDIVGLCRMIAAFARRDLVAPEAQRQRAAELRETTVERVLQQVDGEEREMMRALIDYYQTNASAREDANFYLQYGWPLMRRAVLELAERLVGAGIIASADAVFFLERDELLGALGALDDGASLSSLQEVAEGRRRTWEEWRQLDAPDVLGQAEERDAEKGYFDDEEGRRIVAQGVSPGVHKGRVRFVRTGQSDLVLDKGDVLVTHAASPQLTPLMLVAGALVVEIGGGASHSSLVARELGLPAVVNAAQAMRVLEEGMEVEVDGTRGIVYLPVS
jgi:phosphohistidine swiveling domain-containing protein